MPVPAPFARDWTHRLRAPAAPSQDVAGLLGLLTEVITLPALPPLTGAVALDWYKVPREDVDASDWGNTEVGELISRGKYTYRDRPRLQEVVGRQVVRRLCEVIERHPAFRAVEVVLNVPGHDVEELSFGARMAAEVAGDTGKRLVRVTSATRYRPPAKSAPPERRAAAIRGQFSVDQSLCGAAVLIVDDVFHSGESMRETARAAAVAGARPVYGICAVRTMRK